MKKFVFGSILVVMMIAGFLYASELDKRIETSAQKSYVFKAYLKGDDIQVNSQDGVVTLTGTVSEEFHRTMAADTVSDLPGVKSVDNRLEVKGEIPDKGSDAWIRMNVKNMLMFHRNVTADTQVEVKDGLVTLRGEAGSQAEKQLTAEYVKDVEGVKDVDNQLTVSKAPLTHHRTVGEFIDDASIVSQIKTALLFHRGTNPFRAHVSVKMGVVTVTGIAESAAQKELITKRIDDVHGVKRIHNRMTIG
jgi:hyperosmotically inducible protein